MRRKLHSLLGLGFIACLLAACSGGSGGGGSSGQPVGAGSGSAPTGGSVPSPVPKGTVVIRVLDDSGKPIPRAWASVEDRSGHIQTELIDSPGDVLFSGVAAGPAKLRAGALGYHDSAITTVQVVADQHNTFEVGLEPRDAATAAVLGTRVVSVSTGGTTLVLEADIAVFDESGEPLLGLTSPVFSIRPWDCGWGLCINGPDGRELGSWSPTTGRPEAFTLIPAPSRKNFAAGLLIDQGSAVTRLYADPFRVNAITGFLESFIGADSVALAEFQGLPPAPVLRTNGGFVNDGRSLVEAARGMGERVGGSSPVMDAVPQMLDFMRSQSPEQAPVLVLIGVGWPSELDYSTHDSFRVLASASEAAATPLTTIGSSQMHAAAELAVLTGGSFVLVDDPVQYRAALQGLDRLLGGAMPFYRMRFSLTISPAGVAISGNTLYTNVVVELSERDILHVPIVLPF